MSRPSRYAWLRHLPPEALSQFVNEIADSLDNGQPLEPLLASWKATAEVYSDPELHKKLTTPSEGDFGVAEPPQETEESST